MTDFHLWPDWLLVREIGRGSYGKVYEINRRNGSFLERAALKVIRIPAGLDELEQLRFDGIPAEDMESYLEKQVEEIRSEIGLMQRFVGYSNIVSYEDYKIYRHDTGIGWDILIRMELLSVLSDRMMRYQLTEKDALRIGLDISQALIICHNAGIIHRDIKPQNIFINDLGFYKLGDFGISRNIPGGGSVLSFKGTVSYMAPESFSMRSIDARSDIYSLALVMYRILNGGVEPFLPKTGFTPAQRNEAQQRRLAGEPLPRPLFCSDELWKVLVPALEANPGKQYQTADQFHSALLKANVLFANNAHIRKAQAAHEKYEEKHLHNPVNSTSVRYVSQVLKQTQGRYKEHPRNQFGSRNRNDPAKRFLNEFKASKKRNIGKMPEKKKTFALSVLAVLIVFLLVIGIWRLVEIRRRPDGNQYSDSKQNQESWQDSGSEAKNPSVSVKEQESGNDGGGIIMSESGSDTESEHTQEKSGAFTYPSNTLEYGGHYYYIYDDGAYSWDDAMKKCRERGGYLAVINDSGENEALYQYMLNMGFEEAFFGLCCPNGIWKYIYGDDSAFLDWGVNSDGIQEPTHLDRIENYAELDIHVSDGHWNDARFGKETYTPKGEKYRDLRSYICEWGQ